MHIGSLCHPQGAGHQQLFRLDPHFKINFLLDWKHLIMISQNSTGYLLRRRDFTFSVIFQFKTPVESFVNHLPWFSGEQASARRQSFTTLIVIPSGSRNLNKLWSGSKIKSDQKSKVLKKHPVFILALVSVSGDNFFLDICATTKTTATPKQGKSI